MAPTFHEAFDRLKEQGKVRFLGVSSHTPNLEQVMRQAVDSGRFQMMLVAYNFKNWPDLTDIFRDAHARGIGVVAMKTLKGARATVLKDFAGGRQAFSQAAFKWVLSNPHVSGLVVSIQDFEQIDEYLFASGKPFSDADLALLEDYDQRIAHEYCRPGAASASTTARTAYRSTTCSATACTPRTTAGGRRRASSTRRCRSIAMLRSARAAPRRAKPPVRSASRFARSSCVSTACSPELPDVPRRCVFRRDCGVLRGRARRVSP